MTSSRTARAWLYREQLREIMSRKQPNVVRAALKQWCTNVRRFKVEPMKEVAAMILTHFDGVLGWVNPPQPLATRWHPSNCAALRISQPLALLALTREQRVRKSSGR